MQQLEAPVGQAGSSSGLPSDVKVLFCPSAAASFCPGPARMPPNVLCCCSQAPRPSSSAAQVVYAPVFCCSCPHLAGSRSTRVPSRRSASLRCWSSFLVLFLFFWSFLVVPPLLFRSTSECSAIPHSPCLPSRFVTSVAARHVGADEAPSLWPFLSSPGASSSSLPLSWGPTPAVLFQVTGLRQAASRPIDGHDSNFSAVSADSPHYPHASLSSSMPRCGPCSEPLASSSCVPGAAELSASRRSVARKPSSFSPFLFDERLNSSFIGKGGSGSLFSGFGLAQAQGLHRCPSFLSSVRRTTRLTLPEADTSPFTVGTSPAECASGSANLERSTHIRTQRRQAEVLPRFLSPSLLFLLLHSGSSSTLFSPLHALVRGHSSVGSSVMCPSPRDLRGFSLFPRPDMRRSPFARAVASVLLGSSSPPAAGTSPSATSPTPVPSPRAAQILEEIKKLTIVETVELVSLLEAAFGVSARMMVPGASPASGAAAGEEGEGEGKKEEEKPPEKTEFDVIIKAVPLDKRIAVIKTLRTVRTDLGLKEAKAVIDALPNTVLKNVDKAKAEQAQKILSDAGAEMSIE